MLNHRLELLLGVPMEGVVKLVSEEMSLFPVETDNGFTVFESLETDRIEPGDVVSRSLEAVACDSLFNYSRGAKLAVYVRDMVPTLEAAEALVYND
jgi:hypothetical protein